MSEKVRGFMKLRGLKITALADEAGLSRETIRQVLGGHKPGLKTVGALARVLEVTLDYLTSDRPWDSNDFAEAATEQSLRRYCDERGVSPLDQQRLRDAGLTVPKHPRTLREWEIVDSVANRQLGPRLAG